MMDEQLDSFLSAKHDCQMQSCVALVVLGTDHILDLVIMLVFDKVLKEMCLCYGSPDHVP